MLSRLFWVGIAGAALVTGIIVQEGGWLFDSVERELTVERSVDEQVDRIVDAEVQRAIDSGIGGVEVVGSDGQEIDVPAETKRAMAEAVGRLVKAQADLAILRVRDAGEEEMQAATRLRDQARSDVDRLKAQIRDIEQASRTEQDAVREQVQREIRDDIRTTVREAVRS